MINLDKQSISARWFLFCNRCWAEFTDGRGIDLSSRRTNLCTYFWVSVGAPAVILAFHTALLAFAAWTLIFYGANNLTVLGFLVEIATIALLAAVVYGTIKGVYAISAAIPSKAEQKPKVPKAGPGFFDLLFEYVRAVKSRVCPIIALED